MVDLSIIIVSYNTEELLRQCLESIYHCTKQIAYEIFIVDNNSSDNTVHMVKKIFPKVNLIVNTENKGFAAANNQAMRRAQGNSILLLNPDTRILGNAIDDMVAFITSRNDIHALGCKLLNADMSLQPSVYRFPSLIPTISHILHLWIFKTLKKSALLSSLVLTGYDKNHPVDCVRGACLLIKREVVDKIGYLDEDYFIYAEETDWCFRMKKAGLNVYYFADSQVVHYSGKSSNTNASELFVQRVKSLNIYYKKHFGEKRALVFRILTLLDITIFIIERVIVNCIRRLRKKPIKSIEHFLSLQKWLIKNSCF